MRCTTCNIQIEHLDKKILLSHYKSQFHTFNLKRVNIGSDPVTLSDFEKNISENKSATDQNFVCDWCEKKFEKEKRFQQHIQTCKYPSQEGDCTSEGSDEHAVDFSQEDFGKLTIEEENNSIFSNTTYDPYLMLPNGTILGNKKYFIYFKQREGINQQKKKEETQIIHVKRDFQQMRSREKTRNDLKISIRRNKCLRFREQWSQ